MSQIKWNLFPVLLAAPAALISQSAFATVYFTEQQAQQAIFPNVQLVKNFRYITEEQAKEIEKKTNVNVRHNEIKIWDAADGSKFIIDEVLGKHEFITYAIGLNKDGSVKQIEIMIYNETYGYQVRNKDWRDQFVNKNSTAAFKLDADIKNISGATLSCRHMADGVKRVLTTYDFLFKK